MRPGWQVGIGGGYARETYDPPHPSGYPSGSAVGIAPAGGADLQVAVGRSIGLAPGRGLRFDLIAPLAAHDATVIGALAGTTLDAYYQATAHPLDLGAGVLLGVGGGVYGEAGRRIAGGSWGDLRLDGGVAVVGRFLLFGDPPGVRPFAILSLERHDWTLGAWGDWVRYPEAIKRCDEDCDPDDYLKSRAGAGVLLQRRF